jgi:16S rRNA (guanine527-N7)-methyltransferase
LKKKAYFKQNRNKQPIMDLILKYFPNLSDEQKKQFEALYDLYIDWNAKINVISRKDIENLYPHHVLHSLGIARAINFKPGSKVMDLGTGGGFPGIPLAIMYPETHFHMVDSIGKKVKVAQEVAWAIGLTNVSFKHARAQEEKQEFDFVVSRAVMPLMDLLQIIKKNISKKQQNALPNGLICLKGGELESEVMPVKNKVTIFDLNQEFEEEFFETKKVVYVPI